MTRRRLSERATEVLAISGVVAVFGTVIVVGAHLAGERRSIVTGTEVCTVESKRQQFIRRGSNRLLAVTDCGEFHLVNPGGVLVGARERWEGLELRGRYEFSISASDDDGSDGRRNSVGERLVQAPAPFPTIPRIEPFDPDFEVELPERRAPAPAP